jgi:alpha-ketoglutaric semialdehyde dehydrogenase
VQINSSSLAAICLHQEGLILPLQGISLVGSKDGAPGGAPFHGCNPVTGEILEPRYSSANSHDVEEAARLAALAFPHYAKLSAADRAAFLRSIATGIEAAANEIVDRAKLETGLPEARLRGELARTTNQLRLFAEVVEEGSWVNARIDPPLPDRKPLPRADIRSMLRPLGPVAVFGASNFPLAFSVAGGDTASALAAGNPVIVKAHPAHPGTSELVGHVIRESVRACGLPEGVFSLLFDSQIAVGTQLVQHELVKAVGFTGSAAAGKALMKLAASRPVPIPCYAEMGSVNPLFVLPGAMRTRGSAIATGLQGSFTLGSGQFCTKPGLVFLPAGPESETFTAALQAGVQAMQPQTMLAPNIAEKYASALRERAVDEVPTLVAQSSAAHSGLETAQPVALYSSNVDALLKDPTLAEEVFGPTTLLISYDHREKMLAAAESLEGHLTATIHGTEEDLEANRDLIVILESKVGRLLFNGFPTGVEVCHAMVHGGPYPATSDGRSTSVGTQAIFRFVRPFCYQDFPDSALPAELRNENPLKITRMVNGALTKDSIA